MTNRRKRAMPTETGLGAPSTSEGGTVAEGTDVANREKMMQDAANALAKPSPILFTTHSDAAAMRCEAECKALNQLVAEIDSKIALLEAEREDLMLAYSMQSHALTARKKGAK